MLEAYIVVTALTAPAAKIWDNAKKSNLLSLAKIPPRSEKRPIGLLHSGQRYFYTESEDISIDLR